MERIAGNRRDIPQRELADERPATISAVSPRKRVASVNSPNPVARRSPIVEPLDGFVLPRHLGKFRGIRAKQNRQPLMISVGIYLAAFGGWSRALHTRATAPLSNWRFDRLISVLGTGSVTFVVSPTVRDLIAFSLVVRRCAVPPKYASNRLCGRIATQLILPFSMVA